MKKVLYALGGFIGLLVVAAVVVPFFVDVDQYRPQIVQMAEKNLNGKLVLGKLSLSLWGQIRIDIDGIDLQDSTGKSVVKVQRAFFHLPFSSVFSGSPRLTLKMEKPEVLVVQQKTGKLNVMELVKQTPPTANPVDDTVQPSSGGVTSVALPAIALNARLGFELRNAHVVYRDEKSGLKNELQDLNVVLRDLSLSRPTEIEIWSDLKTVLGRTLSVEGPLRVIARLKPEVVGGKFQQIAGYFKIDLDRLAIEAPGVFRKSKSIPLHVEASFKGSTVEANIESFVARFHNAEIKLTGQVKDLPNAVTDFKLKSNDIQLSAWTELLPSIEGLELGGRMSLDAGIQGPVAALKYFANAQAMGLTAKAPKLKGKPVFNAKVEVVTDQIKSITFDFKAPGAEMRGTGQLVSFSKPNFKMAIQSSGLNLDEMLDLPPKKAAPAAPTEAAPSPSKAGGGGAPVAISKEDDYDAMVQPLRESTMARAAQVDITFQAESIQSYGAKLQKVQSRLTMKDLVAKLDAGFKLWKGQSANAFTVDLRKTRPSYQFKVDLAGLDMKEAVTSQYGAFKNTAYGSLSFDMQGAGQSFVPALATKALSAKGKFKIDQATFASIDVGKLVQDGINGSLAKVGDKVPALKGKQVGGLGQGQSKYQFISADFSIADGTFKMPNFLAKAEPGHGVDLSGSTELGLLDYALNARWSVIDTHNMTKARDLSVEIDGVTVEHILARGSDPVQFPVTVGCFAKSPCYNYGEVPEHFGKIALENVALAARARLESEAKKKAGEAIRQAVPNAPPAVKDALKRFGF